MTKSNFFREFPSAVCLSIIFALPLQAYQKPPEVDEHAWNVASPHFLPEDHPYKAKLDKIFCAKKRRLRSLITLDFGGFKVIANNPLTSLAVVSHPKLKGVVMKILTDDSPLADWYNFAQRAQGSKVIRERIDQLGWQNEFTVPKKWIYPLPQNDFEDINGIPKKQFILVVEKMRVGRMEDQKQLWKSSMITEDKIQKLYVLLEQLGLLDSVYTDNIPIDREGRITFIDTEHFYKWPVPYHRMTSIFRKSLQPYWHNLVGQ